MFFSFSPNPVNNVFFFFLCPKLGTQPSAFPGQLASSEKVMGPMKFK